MRAIVDRIEENKVVLEIGNQMLVYRKSLFPEDIKEGDIVYKVNGLYFIDKKASLERKEKVRKLFDSLIGDKDD